MEEYCQHLTTSANKKSTISITILRKVTGDSVDIMNPNGSSGIVVNLSEQHHLRGLFHVSFKNRDKGSFSQGRKTVGIEKAVIIKSLTEAD